LETFLFATGIIDFKKYAALQSLVALDEELASLRECLLSGYILEQALIHVQDPAFIKDVFIEQVHFAKEEFDHASQSVPMLKSRDPADVNGLFAVSYLEEVAYRRRFGPEAPEIQQVDKVWRQGEVRKARRRSIRLIVDQNVMPLVSGGAWLAPD